MLNWKDVILRSRPCTWTYNSLIKGLGDKLNFGFIAQDLIDEFGSVDTNPFVELCGKYFKVNYLEFIGPLVKFSQYLNERVDFLITSDEHHRTEIQKLTDIIDKQNERISALEKYIGEKHERIDI